MSRTILLFVGALLRVFSGWAFFTVAAYMTRNFILHPADLDVWKKGETWALLVSLDGLGRFVSAFWEDRAFLVTGLCVAAVLLVWSCFTAALMMRLGEVGDEQAAEREHELLVALHAKLQDS